MYHYTHTRTTSDWLWITNTRRSYYRQFQTLKRGSTVTIRHV